VNQSILVVLFVTSILSGCVPGYREPLTWKAMSGSKSDGTLTLAYVETTMDFFNPPPSPFQGQAVASSRCKSWGYTKAVAFDFIHKQCQSQSKYRSINDADDDGSPALYRNTCDDYLITQQYQCEK
jgi:hypothetical protein